MDAAPQSAEQIREEILRRCVAPAAARIVETIKNDRAPLPRLDAAISATPLFAARLIVLAKLALGAAQRISTVSQAASALGLDYIKPLVLGLLAHDPNLGAPPSSTEIVDDDDTTLRGLWEHALASAMLAGKIAGKLANVAPMHAFTAGFIHDVGRVMLWRYSKREFASAVTTAREQQLPIWQAESRVFGTDHIAVGDGWCDRGEIATPLADVVRQHHGTQRVGYQNIGGGADRLVTIIQAAESLLDTAPLGSAGEGFAAPVDPWARLGLSGAVWSQDLPPLKLEIENLREIFGFPRFDPAKTTLYRRDTAPTAPSTLPAAPKPGALGRAQVIPFPVSSETARRFEEQTPSPKLVLLVVEDHGSLCDMVSLFLMRNGYHVRTANNGEVALEILAREEIHMVLLDLMLPRVDGFEVLRQIHKSRRDKVPYIIVVSAAASSQDRSKVLDLGANEYMAKPFHLARLLERVQAVEKFLL